jgi:class 3 adenylate cyclase
VLARLEDELSRGELISAYDTAERARRDGLDHPLIRYRRVLALARAGATETAAKEYLEQGLAEFSDIDSRALWARILKDRALAALPAERAALLHKAGAAYAAIHAETGDSFPGINAATLYALSGDGEQARGLAGALLADERLRGGADYWAAATRAEAQVILGQREAAAAELRLARRLAGRNWGDLSSTRRQLRRLLEAAPLAGFSAEALTDILRPPRVAHLAADAEVDGLTELLRSHEIGFATLALWTEASVAAAEAALAAGIELNLVLPYGVEDYLAHAEARLPPGGAARRRACLAAARSVMAVTADGDHADATLVAYAAVVAKGLARTRARLLSTEWIDLPASLDRASTTRTLSPAGRGQGEGAPPSDRTPPALTRSTSPTRPLPDGERVSAPDQPHDIAPVSDAGVAMRELRALLFADAKGFSKLPESDLPLFWSRFMAEMAAKLDAAGEAVLYRNTWGDAVFCVTGTIEAAAEIALSMQERAGELRREYPRSPVLRIGLHHGPVFRGWDSIRRTPSYFGTQVSRAARVEPIVPPGDVYVTEPFAAVLAATEAEGFETEYVGVLPLHKDYGEHRMYRLARRWAA